eukprot:TRINITY_DN3792_c0_g1_i7.p5 TRINITY_DN3792_c0_g1~~TRINITY_DN3792_c0_g1_i7.p5  ORF type:complete len:108 (-),score=2.07 TRINITY_DN3792_c0_g1_i7:887-1210(-)
MFELAMVQSNTWYVLTNELQDYTCQKPIQYYFCQQDRKLQIRVELLLSRVVNVQQMLKTLFEVKVLRICKLNVWKFDFITLFITTLQKLGGNCGSFDWQVLLSLLLQ